MWIAESFGKLLPLATMLHLCLGSNSFRDVRQLPPSLDVEVGL